MNFVILRSVPLIVRLNFQIIFQTNKRKNMSAALEFTILIWITGFSLTVAMNLTVDASLTSVSGTSYPSLSQAISALVSNNNLTDSKNTITLKASCLTANQTFPAISIQGTGNESLLIQYESTPTTINQVSDCDLLPTVVIASNSFMQFSYMGNLTLVGLNIQYYASTSDYNKFHDITNLTFSDFCFNNSEPNYTGTESSFSSNYYTKFYVDSVTYFIMDSGVYSFDGLKKFWIINPSQVTTTSMLFISLSAMQDSTNVALNVTNTNDGNTDVNITQTQVSCPSGTIVMPQILYISNINNANISGFNVSNCKFNNAASNSQNVISVNGATELLMDSFTLNNLTYGESDSQSVVSLSSNSNTMVSNLQITQLKINSFNIGSSNLIYVDDSFLGSSYPMNISFINFTFNHCDIENFNYVLEFDFASSHSYNNLRIQNISLSTSFISWYTSFLYLEISAPSENTILSYFNSIIINNITFNGNTISSYTSLLTFLYDNADGILCSELFHVQLSNVHLTNNSFNQAQLVQSDGYLISVTTLTAFNVTLSDSSSLFLSNSIVSTYFLQNSQLTKITLSEVSGIAIAKSGS